MTYLEGGRTNKIKRRHDTVERPAGFWSAGVHALLSHLRQHDFQAAPEPLGFTEAGQEIVSYLPGHVSNYPLSPAAASRTALVSAAGLSCQVHRPSVF